jgi:hypothetical protein
MVSTKKKRGVCAVRVIVKQDGDWWVGWIEESAGANAQERTREALLASLREAGLDILALRQTPSVRGGVSNPAPL